MRPASRYVRMPDPLVDSMLFRAVPHENGVLLSSNMFNNRSLRHVVVNFCLTVQ